MKKITLNIAMSVDDLISDSNSGFDWIFRKNNTKDDFNFETFLQKMDIIVMELKSYQDVVLTNLVTYINEEAVVVTSRELEKRENIKFIKRDISKQILNLKIKSGKNI